MRTELRVAIVWHEFMNAVGLAAIVQCNSVSQNKNKKFVVFQINLMKCTRKQTQNEQIIIIVNQIKERPKPFGCHCCGHNLHCIAIFVLFRSWWVWRIVIGVGCLQNKNRIISFFRECQSQTELTVPAIRNETEKKRHTHTRWKKNEKKRRTILNNEREKKKENYGPSWGSRAMRALYS